MKPLNLFILALIFSSLTACGGGDDGYGSDPATTTEDQPAATETLTLDGASTVGSIVITAPVSNAIVDNENGTYRKKFAVSLADQGGLPVDNSTVITLQVVDTILALGTITGADNISGTSVVVNNPLDTAGNTFDLSSSYIVRPGVIDGTHRQILADDLFIMTGAVDSRDVIRTVAAKPTLVDTLTVASTYNASYPAYDTTGYLITASMLSASVAGDNGSGTLVPGQANPLNNEGVATVWVTYPADINYIHAGCTDEPDPRFLPLGSAQPILIATAGGISTYYPFCFSTISGYTLTAMPEAVSVNTGAGSADVTVCVKDGGDAVGVPHTQFTSVGQTEGKVTIAVTNATPIFTNGSGCFTMNVTGALNGETSGATGTVSLYIGDGKLDVVVTVN